MKKIIAGAMLALLTVIPTYAVKRTEAQIDSCVNALLSRMTLEEKIGQLNQYSIGSIDDNVLGQVRGGSIGSYLNIVDPEAVNLLQREAVENSRLGIPLIFARDVIHGFKTIFPLPIGQAASWNPELTRLGSAIAADEASSTGIRWTFSPMVDVSRDARWGRLAEGYGEDPLLNARFGAAAVKGYQGDDLTNPSTMAACVKHFAGYGFVEGGLDYNTTWLPEPLLRDVVLPSYKAAIDAGAATAMCSFNDINGIPPSANAYLLDRILRKEWGFDGLMVSDWGSISELMNHGIAADRSEAARLAAVAGVDMDMEGHCYDNALRQLVADGVIPEARIDSLCGNVLRLKYRLGLFDNPYVDLAKANSFYAPESLEAALKSVEESAILLKNDGAILPVDFSKVKKIAVIGPMADAPHDQNGTWVFDLDKSHSVTPLADLRERYGDKIVYSPGLEFSRDKRTDGFKDALKAARKSDIVFLFAGEEAILSGEAHCRTDLTLPGAQEALIKELKKAGKPVVLIVQAGRPLVMGNIENDVDAILYLFHGGTMAGPGLVNILNGSVNPSGHLPMSFPMTSGQVPIYYSHKNSGRPSDSGANIDDLPLEAPQTSTGCNRFYMDAGSRPRYPFGYGLSYTDFEISTPELSATEISTDGTLRVKATVKNIGNREGQQVVQLYVRDLVGSLTRPVRELKDFAKISLKPGESKVVEFILPASSLSFSNINGKQILEPGEFQVWITDSAESGTPVSFTLK
ncbi:MAG: glycoside hydrolase family 3 C-terminal domain-containing protein [Muribaculaceae bacterium]|nr:glycoside hydrolase family 3 C-terminal domain-containing protein [Muribaculaceae bacterium]